MPFRRRCQAAREQLATSGDPRLPATQGALCSALSSTPGGARVSAPATLASASRWPRKVTWTRKWSSPRRQRWERGAGLGVRPAGERAGGGVLAAAAAKRRRCPLGPDPLSPRRPLSPARLPVGARSRGRSAGVTMTKAGSKGGNLRDKLDGNELDLSLSDLSEVPVKELVSTTPRGLGAPAWAASCPSLSFPVFKTKVAGGTASPGRPRPAPCSSGMYTCHFGAGPGDRSSVC